jgi:hypothetical protein
MPLAPQRRRVARIREQVRDRVLPRRQAALALAWDHRVRAAADRLTPGQDRRPCRGALGLDRVVVEPDPLAGQLVDPPGCGAPAVAGEITPAHVVAQNENDVRLAVTAMKSLLADRVRSQPDPFPSHADSPHAPRVRSERHSLRRHRDDTGGCHRVRYTPATPITSLFQRQQGQAQRLEGSDGRSCASPSVTSKQLCLLLSHRAAWTWPLRTPRRSASLADGAM